MLTQPQIEAIGRIEAARNMLAQATSTILQDGSISSVEHILRQAALEISAANHALPSGFGASWS